MSKANSVSSNNSASSSETSEILSVEESSFDTFNPSKQNNNLVVEKRVFKSVNRMKQATNEKDSETNRPPWRAVSLSTLPKPDKNALLRARLLDASRRLRAGRISVSVQTDTVPVKMMKEINLGVQTDLIYRKEVGILTDGSYAKKRYGINDYTLTYSVSQMTEKVTVVNVSTQTLLPKIRNNFKNLLIPYSKKASAVNGKSVAAELEQSTFIDSQSNIIPTESKQNNFVVRPTLTSWYFDYDAMENISDQIFLPYTVQARDFYSLDRMKNLESPKVDNFVLLNSIDKIIQESNNLMNRLEEQVKERTKRRMAVKCIFDTLPKVGLDKYYLPADQWLPIIAQQEEELKAKLNMLSFKK